MAVFVALLRAVNVGGTRKLPMDDLKAVCNSAGFKAIRTYIASGNVVFESEKSAARVKVTLEKKLRTYAGKPVVVLVRTAAEMADVFARNPFTNAAPNLTVAIFLNDPPPRDALKNVAGKKNEELRLGEERNLCSLWRRHGYVEAEDSSAKDGTARNMNTVAKLAGDGRRWLRHCPDGGLLAIVPQSVNRTHASRSNRRERTMPSLIRFFVVVAILGSLVFAGLWSLANLVTPQPREMTVTIPQDRIGR